MLPPLTQATEPTPKNLPIIHVLILTLTFLAIPQTSFATQSPPPSDNPTIQVTGGEIRGVINDGVASFKAIPFAAPPVGPLRWKSPQPVIPWTGVRDADQYGPAPMQSTLLATLMGGKPSEDCLYLNVWTTAKSPDERRPVMVWIYGGGFITGATSAAFYDGAAFARRGVVLVSIAYRVGPFGFLAHPELSAESGKGSGCYGIQDQIAALRWVQDNITHFGGDPSRVTIFGESAGGISVAILAASPPARGLFHRAISESGGSMAPIKPAADQPGGLIPSLAYAESCGKKFLADLGVPDIQFARALSADRIQSIKLTPCWPVADGQTIVGDPYKLYEEGRFNDTPILIGSNSDDGGMFAMPARTPQAFEQAVRRVCTPAADQILSAYPHATDAQAIRSGRDIIRDTIFAWPSWAWVKLQTEHGKSKAYLYYFDYGSAHPGEVGHSAEIPYVFGNLGGLLRPPPTPKNRATSDLMMSYWINFAATGDPNAPNLPHWPAFAHDTNATMTFDNTPHAGSTPNLEKITALDTYYARLREHH
jgi:para-nitrobenzyl esterase